MVKYKLTFMPLQVLLVKSESHGIRPQYMSFTLLRSKFIIRVYGSTCITKRNFGFIKNISLTWYDFSNKIFSNNSNEIKNGVNI